MVRSPSRPDQPRASQSSPAAYPATYPAGEPIALLGMGCRFPGDIEHADDLWRVVHDGVDATSDIPAQRWDVDLHYAPDRQPGKMYTRRGGFVNGFDEFDPRVFGISGTEARNMAPQQRMLLEVCWATLEDAGIAPDRLAGTRTGVFVGITNDEFLSTHHGELAFGGVGGHMSVAVGRLSFQLGLKGPAIAVDTACSASLVALHLACRSLHSGECDLALVGGVNSILTPNQYILLSDIGALSPDGRCKAFSAAANGFARAEGCGMVVVARHADALTAGYRTRALVRATALNHDGRSSTLIAPSCAAQRELLREIVTEAGLSPDDITYVEAHGTGTAVGDPIEFEAMRGALMGARTNTLRLGAIKSNLGHLESAAGMASLIKAVLSLERAELAPNLHLERVNPRIELAGSGASLLTERVPWRRPEGGRRMVGISGFGFAGTNAHIILEELPEDPMAAPDNPRPRHLLCLSAKSDTALAEMARRYQRHLRETPSANLGDVCHTAALGRAHFEHRLALVVENHAQAIAALDICAQGPAASAERADAGIRAGVLTSDAASPRVAFLFSGQGAQYPGMGKALYEHEPVFRAALDSCAEALREQLPRPLLEVMFAAADPADPDGHDIHNTGYTQPALFALEYALFRLWESWGVRPWAVLGHSVGEFAAACAAGVLDLGDALELIAARGRLMQALPRDGSMLSVRAGHERVGELLGDDPRVSIAAINGPRNTVIAGQREAVSALGEQLASAGIQTRALTVSHAFHSPLMDPMLDEFEALAANIEHQPPRCRLVSNLTGVAFADGETPDAAYWRRHVREPVRFLQGMQHLVESGADVFIELGPHPVLTGMAQLFSDDGSGTHTWLASLHRERDPVGQIATAAAGLYTRGVEVDWAGFYRDHSGRMVALPTYPFERKRYWIEPRRGSARGLGGAALHPLLGQRLPSARAGVPFHAEIGADEPAYLDHHRVHGMALFPATGYVELALAAVRAVRGGDRRSIALQNLSFERALVLPDAERCQLQVLLTPAADGRMSFEVYSQNSAQAASSSEHADTPWHLHARGDAVLAALDHHGTDDSDDSDDSAAAARVADWRQRFTDSADVGAHYQSLADEGLQYGPSFQGIAALWTSKSAPGQALASIQLPQPVREDAAAYLLHPALLDACLQVIGAARHAHIGDGAQTSDTYLPIGVDQVRFHDSASEVLCHVRLSDANADSDANTDADTDADADADTSASAPAMISADIELVTPAGRPVAHLGGVRLQRVERRALRQLSRQDVHDWLYEITWQALSADASPALVAPGTWLILTDAGGTGSAIARALTQRGQRCVLIAATGDKHRETTPIDRGNQGIEHWCDPTKPELLAEIVADIAAACASKTEGQAPLRGVLYLWALDADPVRETSEATLVSDQQRICAGALHLVQALSQLRAEPPALLLVTRSAQRVLDGDCVAATQAALWGLGRVIALEHPEYRCQLIDLEARPDIADGREDSGAEGIDDRDSVALLGQIGQMVQIGPAGQIGATGQETQVAVRANTQRYGARLTRLRKSAGRPDAGLARPDADCFALTTARPGVLDELVLTPAPRPAPGPGQVEFEVVTAGLNFRDVMNAMGAYPGGPEPLGGEGAGRITAVGEGVSDLAVGDEVVVGLTRGAFRRFVLADATYVAPKPPWLDFADAVTLPITFLTAAYGLLRLAKLDAGERVLIHAAAGGVGLAAVQLAQRAGAEIFATAGSPRKRDYLRALGVPHVLDSRSLAFADQIRALTSGQGVDVVLNSLAGDFVNASMSLLGSGGRFVEIGKVDILDDSAVPAGVSYHHFDLGDACERDNTLWRTMFAELIDGIAAGALRPLPREVYAIEAARNAFRYMAQGRHIGKLVLAIAPNPAPDPARDFTGTAKDLDRTGLTVAADGAYLITGGLGGIGLQMARALVERGAGRVVLMSRRRPSDQVMQALREIEHPAAPGTRVVVAQGDVAHRDDVARVLAEFTPKPSTEPSAKASAQASAEASAEPDGQTSPHRLRLRGIIHAAGVLEDGVLARLRWDDFIRVLAPKVYGAWHLHQLTRGHNLDFFVAFSSMTAILGNAGQGNYAAANTYLDALMQYRRGQGLPALAIDWGIWRQVGMAAADPERRLAPLEARGIDGIDPEDGLSALSALLAARVAQAGVMPIDWARYLSTHAGPPPALLADLANASGRADKNAPAAPSLTPERVADAVLDEVRRVLDLSDEAHIDPAEPLERLGLDSLMAVELRNRLGGLLGANLPASLLFDYPSIDELADYIRTDVLAAVEPDPADGAADSDQTGSDPIGIPAAPAAEPASPSPAGADANRVAAILAAIDSLSDEEQQELLDTLFEGEA